MSPAPSGQNMLTQVGRNEPVSFTLDFAGALAGFTFIRPKLLAGPNGITHPQWSAHAFDAQGREVASAQEDLIRSFEDVPARSFTLPGPGIKSVRFDSDGRNFAAFSAVLVEELGLDSQP